MFLMIPCDQSPIKLLAFEPQLPEGSAIIQRDQGVSKSMSPKLPDGIQQEILVYLTKVS